MKVFLYGANGESLKASLESVGFEVVCDPKEAEVSVCFNWQPRFSSLLRALRRASRLNVLLISEPSIVTPQHTRKHFLEKFDKVIEIGRPNSDFLYPIQWETAFLDQEGRRSKIVAMSSNKFSCFRGELYSLRRLAYANIPELEVYGPGWSDSKLGELISLAKEGLRSVILAPDRLSLESCASIKWSPLKVLGSARNKLETLSGYKVSLVIENSLEYMSEKLIEALLAGCIPVYVGPDPGVYGIPKELIFYSEPDLQSLLNNCQGALSQDYDAWFEVATKWLKKPDVFEAWQNTVVKKRISGEILELARTQMGIPKKVK